MWPEAGDGGGQGGKAIALRGAVEFGSPGLCGDSEDATCGVPGPSCRSRRAGARRAAARGRLRPLTGAALDGPHGGGGARRGGGPQGHALVVLRAALLDGAHVAVAPHAEAAGHRQVQGFHRLRLQLAEHRLAHRLELPVHLHLAHLPARRLR